MTRAALIGLIAFAALAPTTLAQSDTQTLLHNYEEQIANLKLVAADKDQKIAALDQELTLTRQNRDLLQQIIAQTQQIADIQKQSIADRDAIIQQLARGSHDSTVMRLVESIPSIAGIIAIALK